MVIAIGRISITNTEPVKDVMRLVRASSVNNKVVSIAEKVLSIAPLLNNVAAISAKDPISLASVNR